MEQQTKHTPGPWTATYLEAAGKWEVANREGQFIMFICELYGFDADETEAANAQLIAEAPTTAAERDSLKEQVEQLKAQALAESRRLVNECAEVKIERDKLKEEKEQLIKSYDDELTVVNNVKTSYLNALNKLKEENERLNNLLNNFSKENEAHVDEVIKLRDINKSLVEALKLLHKYTDYGTHISYSKQEDILKLISQAKALNP